MSLQQERRLACPELAPELEPWLKLSLTPGLSDGQLRQLLIAFGSPEAILAASSSALARVVPARTVSAIGNGAPPEHLVAAAQWLVDPANHVLTLADTAYPSAWLEIPDPPPVLYAKGRLDLLQRPAVAVVGSRNATPQGITTAKAMAQALADAGLVIVSGLALGIDAAAHEGGLAGAAGSIAIVGTGLDTVYPARNRGLAHRLAERGLLLSEFALGTPALASNFPRRNRLISGLARGCLVVEAALASGSLITARLANEQGKDVFAVPGSIHSPLSKGCHHLIRQGAKLTESALHVLEELKLAPTGRSDPDPAPEPAPHDPLLEQMGYDPCSIDTLANRTGLPVAEITARVTQLEIAGDIASLPGGLYQRTR
jgi:DNA processing protein